MFVPNSYDMNSAEIRNRISAFKDEHGYSDSYMADALSISIDDYKAYENGDKELNYAFLYNCAQIFNIDINEIIDGKVHETGNFTITRRGKGIYIKQSRGMIVKNIAPGFRNRMVEPLLVRIVYDAEKENEAIELSSHYGQEVDYVVEGSMKMQIGDEISVLNIGDAIFFDSSTPHGMIAVGGSDCKFLAAMVSPEDVNYQHSQSSDSSAAVRPSHIWEEYITPVLSDNGIIENISFHNTDHFNFAFDIVDRLGDLYPDKTAMIHISQNRDEERFTFKDMKKKSGRAANYLSSIGIRKGDKVMLVLRRTWQYWIIMLALEKIGAIAIPTTDQLLEKDFVHRFRSAGVNAVIACNDRELISRLDNASHQYGKFITKISVNGHTGNWCDFDCEYDKMTTRFLRSHESISGNDTMLMIFQAVANDMAKPVTFDCTYPLASFVSGQYWNCDDPDSLSLAVADSAWVKSLWCKLFGPWLCETPVFVYDFRSLKLSELLKYIEKYRISTFCAPASMFRALLTEDLSQFDLSSLKHFSCSGDDVMSPEVQTKVQEVTGIPVYTGFGLSETALLTGIFNGMDVKAGSVGKANPIYDIHLFDDDGNEVEAGVPGEMCVSLKEGMPCGLLKEYYHDNDLTKYSMRGGYFHTGDLFWKDEDGYYWHIGRIDDVIRTSGYRVGPYEVECIISELPYVIECGVTGVPDETRGQVIKAGIVLTDDKEPTEDLKAEIQDYVRTHTAPYRVPRIISFRTELPKNSDGTVIRSKI